MGRDVVVVGIPSGDCECWCLLVREAAEAYILRALEILKVICDSKKDPSGGSR